MNVWSNDSISNRTICDVSSYSYIIIIYSKYITYIDNSVFLCTVMIFVIRCIRSIRNKKTMKK